MGQTNFILTFLCILVGQSCYSQDNFTKRDTVVELKCFSRNIKFTLPTGFNYKRFYYVEGSIDIFLYSDSTRLTIHCGGEMQLPLLSGARYVVDQKTKGYRSGKMTGSNRYWREDNLSIFNLCYEYVSHNEKSTFDEIVATIKKQVE